MATDFTNTQAIPEGSSRRYSATLQDLDGVALQSGQVSSILFSLRDARSNQVINGRDRIEVRNANGGTFVAGAFAMTFNPSDTVAVGTSRYQKRRAVFQVTFSAGVENHEVTFYVENLHDLPNQPLSGSAPAERAMMADIAPSAVRT